MIEHDQQKKDEFYMQRALDEARLAYKEGEIPIGAVLFSNRYGIIGKTKEADRLIRQLIEER